MTAAPNGLSNKLTFETNGADGIFLIGASNVLIGSNADGISDPLERNIISGNTGNGIDITRATCTNINIAGNYIGTDKTGSIAVPNAFKATSAAAVSGIAVNGFGSASHSNIVIGFNDATMLAANAAAARNVISGNYCHGIQCFTNSGLGNKISGNYIGVNATGNIALGNGQFNISHPSTLINSNGIDVSANSNLLIGTDGDDDDDALERNVISGNIDARGVYIRNNSPSNIVAGNYIGVGADGTTAVGNDFSGVHIDASSDDRIGSDDNGIGDAAEANIIANNGKSVNASFPSNDGVRITNSSTQNRISRNIFYSNKATPIDLANDGVSPNDGVTTAGQPNSLLDYPVFTAYNIAGTTMTLSGYVGQCNGTETGGSTTIGGSTIVQVYKVANDGDQDSAISLNGCNRSVAHGEGVQYLGSINITGGVFINASFTLVTGASFSAGDKLTGITIDANGNTSEFGAEVAPVGYIYVHKKSMSESLNADFDFSITGGATSVLPFKLNDNAANIQIKDLGAAQNGRLWAVGKDNNLYYRNSGSSVWVNTGVTTASRVDGGPGGICYYTTTTGNVFSYDGTTTTQIYSGTDAIDIASSWSGQPFMIAGAANTIYRFNGTAVTIAGWAIYNSSAAGAGYSQIDGNPSNGNIYGRSTNGNVYMIPSGAVAATSLGGATGAGAFLTGKEDIGIAADGGIYGIWQFGGGGNWYVYKWQSGTTWSTPELESRYADVVTGGVGGQVWANNAFFLAVPVPYSNIITRATNGTTISWIDDERVRTSPVAGNSYLIPVTPGNYTVTETAAAGWELSGIDIYDPTNNTTASVPTRSASVNVAAGEMVNLVYQNKYINTTTVSTTCSGTNYIQTFGNGTPAFAPPIAGLTSMHYIAGTKFADGYYSLEKNASSWSLPLLDHTSDAIDGNADGYFMTINASYAPEEFFRQRVTGLLPNIPYTLSFYAANLSPSAALKPDITFGSMDISTGSISSIVTGNITASTWTQYSYTFIPTSTSMDLFIRNNAAGGDGNDLALDDITFAIAPPITPVTLVSSVGCGALGSIEVTSPVGPIYEYSINNTTWQQYPATTFSSLMPGTYTVSARFTTSTGCVVSKSDVLGTSICGSIWDDANGNAINAAENFLTSGVWVNLVNPITHDVIKSVQVDASGGYSFKDLPQNTNYQIILTSTNQTGNLNLISYSPPTGYVATGTNLNGAASTTNTTGVISVNTGTTGLTAQNFGLEQPPMATTKAFNVSRAVFSGTPPASYPVVPGFVSTPSSSTNLTGYNGTGGKLSGTDPEDCAGADACSNGKTFTIGTINSNTRLYYDFGAGPVLLTSNTPIPNYDPTKLVIYGQNGSGTTGSPIGFTYSITDAAGKVSPLATYSIISSAPLPVDLISFTGAANGCSVMLNWTTANEWNVDRFEIEASQDSKVFTMVGYRMATNKASGTTYDFETVQQESKAYYRLKKIDNSGAFKYSSTLAIQANCGDEAIRVYPNPAMDVLQISGIKPGYEVSLMDMNGRIVIASTVLSNGALPVAQLPSGNYWIKVKSKASITANIRFLKK